MRIAPNTAAGNGPSPSKSHDGYVIGNTHQDLPVHPHGVVPALTVDAVLDPSADRHHAGFLGAYDLPGRAFRQPVLRLLALVSVVDLLLEKTVLVIDSVAVSGHTERRHRVQQARSQTPRAPRFRAPYPARSPRFRLGRLPGCAALPGTARESPGSGDCSPGIVPAGIRSRDNTCVSSRHAGDVPRFRACGPPCDPGRSGPPRRIAHATTDPPTPCPGSI